MGAPGGPRDHARMTRFASLPLALVALVALVACGTEDDLAFGDELDVDAVALTPEELALRTNSDPNRLVVYSNNIENMIYDWKDLVHEMEEHALRPDVFLVQQISSKRELERLIRVMEQRLGVQYEGVVAQNVPDDHRFRGEVTPRPRVTTGVVWRKGRLELKSKDTWFPFGRGFAGQRQSCDRRASHSGYETVRVKLRDKRAQKDIVAVSLRHWTWEPCSEKNIKEIVEGQGGGGPNSHAGLGDGAALHIVAGDFNDNVVTQGGAYKCWYRRMNGALDNAGCGSDFGFTDPLFEHCDGRRACVDNLGGIDSVFVRRSDGRKVRTSNFDVISFAEAHQSSVRATGGDARSNLRAREGWNDVNGNYSQNRSRRAYVYYR